MPTTAAELSALELFEGCTDDDLAVMTGAVTGVRRVREGEVICAEDEVADRWWIVVDGQADVTRRGLYLGTILPGETIGELALLDGRPRTATVTAMTDMVLHELEGEGFVAALLKVPNVAVALLRQFATRLRAADKLPVLTVARPRPDRSPPARSWCARPSHDSSILGSTAISRIPTPTWRRSGSRRRRTGPTPFAPTW